MVDIFILAKVFYLTLILSVELYTKPLPTLLKALTPPPSFRLKNWDISKVVKWLDFFSIWGIPPFRESCLKRSLILYKFLREKGIDVKINIGVKKEVKEVRGHAWLTLNGKPYLIQAGIPQKFTLCFVFPP